MKFYIAVVETHSTVVEVEADSLEEAKNKTIDAYNEGVICLDGKDYVDDTDFLDETDAWSGMEYSFLSID